MARAPKTAAGVLFLLGSVIPLLATFKFFAFSVEAPKSLKQLKVIDGRYHGADLNGGRYFIFTDNSSYETAWDLLHLTKPKIRSLKKENFGQKVKLWSDGRFVWQVELENQILLSFQDLAGTARKNRTKKQDEAIYAFLLGVFLISLGVYQEGTRYA